MERLQAPEGQDGGERAGFWAALRDPRLPGMDDDSPVARRAPFAICLLLLAAQVVARYRGGVLEDDRWFLAHLLWGWGVCAAVIAVAHGRSVLASVRPRTWVALALGIGAFLLFWHFGRVDTYNEVFRPMLPKGGRFTPILGHTYFGVTSCVLRLMLPFSLAWWLWGQRPSTLGLSARGSVHAARVRGVGWLYAVAFAAVLPFVVAVSQTPAFLEAYPMCGRMIRRGVLGVDQLLFFEAGYLLIFVSGEAFWRGYLTFTTERDLGAYSIVFMVVPYVIAHFGKPMSETLGAIVAGSLLGWLALKHRSVWYGVALHYGVALTMDLLALWGRGVELRWVAE